MVVRKVVVPFVSVNVNFMTSYCALASICRLQSIMLYFLCLFLQWGSGNKWVNFDNQSGKCQGRVRGFWFAYYVWTLLFPWWNIQFLSVNSLRHPFYLISYYVTVRHQLYSLLWPVLSHNPVPSKDCFCRFLLTTELFCSWKLYTQRLSMTDGPLVLSN